MTKTNPKKSFHEKLKVSFPVSILLGINSCSGRMTHAIDLPGPHSLKEAASLSHIFVGTEVETLLLKKDSKYAEIVKRESNLTEPQNEMKFG